MVISKFICIPLLIIVPLIILFFESRDQDFTVPPSDDEVREKVEAWKEKRPSLKESQFVLNQVKEEKPEENVEPTLSEEEIAAALQKEEAEKKAAALKKALKMLDLGLSPSLNHLQGMKANRLKVIASQLDAEEHAELVYIANERLLDSAVDSSVDDRHSAGEYVSKHARPLWNPEESLRVPLKFYLNVEGAHFDKAQALVAKVESSIFYGSGGTVTPKVILKKVAEGKNSILIEAKKRTQAQALSVQAVPDTEKMIVNAIQQAVHQSVIDHQLPILHTDKIHYTYYTRLTWLLLAEAL